MNKYQIYTDGSSCGNPGPGGWGVVVMQDNAICSIAQDQYDNTTNNREELKAIIYAIKIAKSTPSASFTIYSDSAYCVKICNEWIHGWAKNNWLTASKKSPENLDLVHELYNLLVSPTEEEWSLCNFSIQKVEGHIGLLGNELADALATNNMRKFNELVIAHNIDEAVQ